jgi:chemotaxis protein MotB
LQKSHLYIVIPLAERKFARNRLLSTYGLSSTKAITEDILIMARRKEAHGGGHGWFVTFADLMGLLVSFFVMLVAFSNQDAKQMRAVAGSMREAFGVQNKMHYDGLTEMNGLPTREKLKYSAHIQPEDASNTPTPNEQGSDAAYRRAFKVAVASLRRALKDLPELTEASRHVNIEESDEGLNIDIVDQDGESMFRKGSKEPNERMRRIFERIADPLRVAPFRISITGHTATRPRSSRGSGNWQLSIDRANAVRQILEASGYPSSNIYRVAGKADTDPLIRDDPSVAPNRRVTITLIYEPPPVPPDLHP